ncbi:uncharacterized protein Z519_01957 [Cladophialophora bantiana CBS 173.52]|uniref:Uncharacterized protein n=1 Tax=Cladophialophora bantiana (strain ATCC 10958 / CBS 173.52 / CDC B-1940 / NIH 8579) TaxID=1442370 RepID=A0A0D2F2Y9_CLAB1|nr:uncharacterized protein Z519_01957 [Cladophialophora bantiana CBS 173.52]KIW96566.1 hypothetical protein Z519_01957 [Cladophialophora bantiana CBS 173.52]
MPPPMKRRRTEPTVVEEITFDPTARREFLTGFHKRKLQKAKQAQEAAERRARVERVEQRKRLREQRMAELERHVQEVNAILRSLSDSDEGEGKEDGVEENSEEEWSGISDSEPTPLNQETEYIDEEKYTTVTVEAMNISREGLFKAEQEPNKDGEEERGEIGTGLEDGLSGKQKRRWTRDRPKDTKRRKKRNFRYESKAERKEARGKEKAKNRKQAQERRGDGR